MGSDERDPSQGTQQTDSRAVAELLARAEKKRASFVVLDGLDVGRIIPVGRKPVLFGRDPDCSVPIQDDSVSRHHAEAVREISGRVVIRDLGSTNGTFVGGKRIERATLEDGDRVLVGRKTLLKFVLQDAVEQEYQEEMYKGSTRDALTGAHNRKYFNHRLVEDLSYARRHEIPISLLMLDIDHFKKVNDEHGHPVGDQVLARLGRALRDTIRTEDTLARYGGEEFAIIALGIDEGGGLAFGERVRRRVAVELIPFPDDPATTLQVTVSVGVATVPPGQQTTPETLVAVADRGLYEAKAQGRDRVVGDVVEPALG